MFTPEIFTQVINHYLPEPHASLMNGILFGVKLKTSSQFYLAIKKTGLLHLVVLSGVNISILAAIVANFTKNFPKKLTITITISSIIIFTIFVGAAPPIIRAAFTGTVAYLAIFFGRKNIPFYTLMLSLLFIAIFWPSWLSTVSLQLSYAATIGLILFGGVKEIDMDKLPLLTKIKYILWKDLKPSLVAYFSTLPIIWVNFKQISLIAPISNVLVGGLVPILTIFGFLMALLGKINFWLGLVPSYVCYSMASYIIFVIEKTASLPYIFYQF